MLAPLQRYERSRGTATGTAQSEGYCQSLWRHTVRWAMIDQLSNPHPAFRKVILRHFALRKAHVLQTCMTWLLALKTGAEEFAADFHKLSSLLDKLPDFKEGGRKSTAMTTDSAAAQSDSNGSNSTSSTDDSSDSDASDETIDA